MRNQQKGLAPLVIVAIVAVVLAVAGVGGYFGYQAFNKPEQGQQPLVEGVTEQVDEEPFVILPDLFGEVDVTGTGLSSGELPGFGVSGDYDVSVGDFDFSGLSGFEVVLSAPDASVSAPPVPDLTPADFDFSGVADKFAAQQQQQQQQAPPPDPPPESQVNAANCAQFSSMPSASYCSQVGNPDGVTLCQQCKAAGY